jgi:hypothetical protein
MWRSGKASHTLSYVPSALAVAERDTPHPFRLPAREVPQIQSLTGPGAREPDDRREISRHRSAAAFVNAWRSAGSQRRKGSRRHIGPAILELLSLRHVRDRGPLRHSSAACGCGPLGGKRRQGAERRSRGAQHIQGSTRRLRLGQLGRARGAAAARPCLTATARLTSPWVRGSISTTCLEMEVPHGNHSRLSAPFRPPQGTSSQSARTGEVNNRRYARDGHGGRG